jgi:hypothetical protein
VTLTYKTAEAETEPSEDVVLTGIRVKTEPTLAYTEGEYFTLEGLELTLTYSDNTTDTAVYNAEKFQSSLDVGTVLTQENAGAVTITYEGKQTTLTITVSALDLDDLEDALKNATVATDSITITDPADGNTYEYAIAGATDDLTWTTATDGTVKFTGLTSGTSYTVYGRVQASDTRVASDTKSATRTTNIANLTIDGKTNTAATLADWLNGTAYQETDNATVTGDITLPAGDYTVPNGKTLTVQSGHTLTLADGATLTVTPDSPLVVESGATLVLYGTLAITDVAALHGAGSLVMEDGSSLIVVPATEDDFVVGGGDGGLEEEELDEVELELEEENGLAETMMLSAAAAAEETESGESNSKGIILNSAGLASPFQITVKGVTHLISNSGSGPVALTTKLVIPVGATLIVENDIELADGGSIENNGTVQFVNDAKLIKDTTTDSTNTDVKTLGLTGNVIDEAGNPMVGTPIYDGATIPDPLTGNFYVPYGRTLTVTDELNLSAGTTLRVNGTLAVDDGGTLTIADTANLIVSGDANSDNGALTNNGTIANNGTLTVAENGTLESSGTLTNNGALEDYGTLALTRDAAATDENATGGTLTGTGSINVLPSASLTIGPDASLTLTHDDNTGASGTLTSRGTILLVNSDESDDGTHDGHAAGTLTIESGATASLAEGELDCGGTIENDGTLEVTSDDVTLDFGPDEEGKNKGSVANNGTVKLADSHYANYQSGAEPFADGAPFTEDSTGTIVVYVADDTTDTTPETPVIPDTPAETYSSSGSSGGGGGGGDDGGGAVILLAGAAVAVVGGVILAQKMGLFTEKITGVVTDDYGNLLNGATVIMQQDVNGEITNVQMTNTDETGRYYLVKPEGVYTIIAQYVDATTGKTRTAHVYEDNPTEYSQTTH